MFHNKKILYSLLFPASADSLQEIAAEPKHLRRPERLPQRAPHLGPESAPPSARPLCHPGGWSLTRSQSLGASTVLLLPAGEGTQPYLPRQVRRRSEASLPQQRALFARCPEAFGARQGIPLFLRSLFRRDWFVYAKPPFSGPRHVPHYLARYTHRVAICNHRLIAFADGKVTSRWKDYAYGSKRRLMTLTAEEFLRRFLLHILPRGFVRIRFFGFLAHRRRGALLPLCQQLLDTNPASGSRPSAPNRRRRVPAALSAARVAEGSRIASMILPRCSFNSCSRIEVRLPDAIEGRRLLTVSVHFAVETRLPSLRILPGPTICATRQVSRLFRLTLTNWESG